MIFGNFSNFSVEELRQIIKVICLYTMLEHTTKFLELWDKNKKFEKLFCSIVQYSSSPTVLYTLSLLCALVCAV